MSGDRRGHEKRKVPNAIRPGSLCALACTVPPAAAAPSTEEPEIEMEDFSFRPARLTVRPGALVVWKTATGHRTTPSRAETGDRSSEPVWGDSVQN
jgi:plastocyanin